MATIDKRLDDLEKKLIPPEETKISVRVVRTGEDGILRDALTGEIVPEPKPGDKVIRVGIDLEAI